MKENIERKEKNFYVKLGVKDFNDFKNFWHFYSNNGNVDNSEIILNAILDLFTGETVRLVTDKQRTQIEQLFSLKAIQLDRLSFEGIEDTKVKTSIKDKLVKANLLEVLEDSQGQYVPVKGKSTNFFDELDKTITKELDADSLKKSEEVAFKEIQDMIAQLGAGSTIASRLNKTGRVQTSNLFVSWNISSKWSAEAQRRGIIRHILSFIHRAAVVQFDNNMWEIYNKDWVNNKGTQDKFIQMLEDFFTTTDKYQQYLKGSNSPGAKVNSNIQGLFGEISAYGHLYFNKKKLLNSDNIKLFSLGNVINESGKLSGVDIAINIDGESFGFQVKNPFRTDNKKGDYQTYKESWQLNDAKDLYSDKYLNLNDEQQELFELINLNLNNTNHVEYIEALIKQFILVHNQGFLRLNAENFKDNDILKDDFDNVQNIFYILKGEIIPSAKILEGLIEQYKILAGLDTQQIERNNMRILYKNLIERKVVKPETDLDKFDRSYIVEGEQAKNLLSQVTLTTSLILNLPSIRSFIQKNI